MPQIPICEGLQLLAVAEMADLAEESSTVVEVLQIEVEQAAVKQALKRSPMWEVGAEVQPRETKLAQVEGSLRGESGVETLIQALKM